MCINCLPPAAEILGDNPAFTLIRAGGTDVSRVIREPIIQPATTHGYFTQSQNKRHGNAPHMVESLKCQNNTKGLKPSPGPQTKARKQMEGALGGDKSVPSKKKPSRGWANKGRVQGSSPPTNDSMTPSQAKSGRGLSKKPKAQVGWSLSLNPAVLHQKQLDGPDIGPVLKWKESGQRPFGPEVCASSPATRHYWNCWDLLHIQDGMLMCHFVRHDATGNHMQFIVPRSSCNEILHHIHNSLLGGHLGQKKTREKALQRFYWSSIREVCNSWVSKCDACTKVKHPSRKPHAPLGEMPVGILLDRLSKDILGSFPESTQGNKYILAVTDYFTKWVEIFAIPDQSAATCAKIILNKVIARFGCPYDIHSDQGCNNESALFSELCQLLGICKTRTTPGHPHCNGQVECFNRTLVGNDKILLEGPTA